MQSKKIISAVTIAFTLAMICPLLSSRASEGTQCMMVVTYSEMASIQFKKAYKAASVDEAKKFVKKGMSQVQQAAAYAPQCNCIQAETYALEAYTFAKKGYDAASLEEMQKQVKKAMDLSIDAMAAGQKCNQ